MSYMEKVTLALTSIILISGGGGVFQDSPMIFPYKISFTPAPKYHFVVGRSSSFSRYLAENSAVKRKSSSTCNSIYHG